MSSQRRITQLVTAVVGGFLIASIGACGDPAAPVAPPDQPSSVAVAAPPPEPVADGPCPYLDQETVESVNAQRVGSVQVSDDEPYPACFFFRGDGREQLRVWILVASPEVARATVDAAAPVATSDLAELAGDWSGGSQPTDDGAVFAVSRLDTAVVVTTNQPRTTGARRLAEQVITALNL